MAGALARGLGRAPPFGRPIAAAPATGILDLELRNVDGDPALEIVVATEESYEGLIEIFDYAPDGTFTLAWSNASRPPSSSFYSVEVADLDGDGSLEVMGGTGHDYAGPNDVTVHAYRYDTGALIWQSAPLAQAHHVPVSELVAADSDGDGVGEIHALVRGGALHVFDGATFARQASVGASLRGVDVRPGAGSSLPFLWLSDGEGRLATRRWDGLNYAQRGVIELATEGPLEALTFGPASSLYVAHEGKLSFLPTLTSPAPTWTLAGWGPAFGRHVVRVEPASLLVTSNDYAVLAFEDP